MLLNYRKAIIILVLCLGISACDNDAATGNEASVEAKPSMPATQSDDKKPEQPVAFEEPLPVKNIDPLVDDLISKASDQLVKAKSFSVRSSVHVDEVFPNGQMIQLARSVNVLVRRPDRFHAKVISDKGEINFYYNGKTITRFDPRQNTYGMIEVPNTLDAALDNAIQRFQVTAPLADFLTSDPYENISENALTGFYAGLHYLDGEMYHHLLLSNDNVDFQLWISNDDKAPMFRKFVITYKHTKGAPQYTANLTNWVFNPDAPDTVFDFHPPKQADKIEFLPVSSRKGGA